MKSKQGLLILLAVGTAGALGGVSGEEKPEAGNQTARSKLSGILHKDEKTIMPYLVLDGSDERCYLRGSALAAHPTGTHLQVEGVLCSELFDATGTDWTKPGAPAPPPFRKGWAVYLEVQEAKVATEPLGRTGEASPTEADHRDLQAKQTLNCEILSDGIPNPLIVRLNNPGNAAVQWSTFSSTHATMPPMPNVRIGITDRRTHQTQHYTPVVLTKLRARRVIGPGESVDVRIYHHGLKLEPGTYELMVSFFDDADIQQKAPVAVSSLLLARENPRTGADIRKP